MCVKLILKLWYYLHFDNQNMHNIILYTNYKILTHVDFDILRENLKTYLKVKPLVMWHRIDIGIQN